MREANVSAALVGGRCEAIVTERDLTRALASGLGPEAAVSVASVLDPVTIEADQGVVDAAAEMLRREIRHLVVTDDGEVLGVVSLRDVMVVLLQALDPAVWVATLREALTVHTEMWLG
jgi:CBS domain-containing protein